MAKQRLDKFISNQLIIPRSVVRTGIRRGKAQVNGQLVRDAGALIETSDAKVMFEGREVGFKEHIYILMNKPAGVLSASNDKSRQTVVDLVPEHLRRSSLFPVGRLDKDTTGLLLITDDGVFAHNCISPKKHISKAYIAELDGNINDQIINEFKNGVILADGSKCASAILQRIADKTVRIVISEGKYHQIKRMFGTVGLGVNKLHRESIGGLYLPEGLKEGNCIEMEKEKLQTAIVKDTYVF